jgi:hypothetical protein
MELFDLAVGIVLGFGISFVMLGFHVKAHIDHTIEQLVEQAATQVIGLTVEVDQGQYFCYNSEDKQFVCQGSTAAEIRQAFEARFPGKIAFLDGGDPEAVSQFRTELAQLKANENSPRI